MSVSCDTYWGKAGAAIETAVPSWHPLPRHCLDVAATGVAVLERLPALQRMLSEYSGLPAELLPNWVAFWLALHDLGKFAEAFQSQREDLFAMLRGRRPDPTRPYTLRHDSLGMLFWTQVIEPKVIDETWFGNASEDIADGLRWWARASTGHHGQPPQEGGAWTQHFHPQDDCVAALAFVQDMREMFIGDELAALVADLDPGRFLAASKELSWWMAGLAVLADWLGSNTRYFPYDTEPMPRDQYWATARGRAANALQASGILPPPRSGVMTFADLFPAIVTPSPLQAWATNVSLHDGPQIYLLEDVTGAGKTEAALMLTHRLMAVGHADGFFIALPTMATANAMYERIAPSYGRFFDGWASLALAHGQRNLVDAFAATVVEDLAAAVLPSDTDEHDARQQDDTASARCAAWLADHNKRSLLAPAGVGTIDQALLAVLYSRHQSLRLLGLMRKVLVVDEVHACDDYMENVLAVLLEFHAHAGGSAILLSATLPQRMKRRLLAAYARGLGAAAPEAGSSAYPLATSWPASGELDVRQTEIATRPEVQRRVRIQPCESAEEVVTLISQALAQGQCVCWVRNTVADAMEAFDLFHATVPADRLMLFHARFALHDRLAIEQQVLAYFGRSSTAAQRAGRLVIATQVVEQSLDVDFDMLVTDLAPIDRIVQRAGRLRRHPRATDGTPLSTGVIDQRGGPVLHVLQPPWADEPDARWLRAALPKTATVYPHHGQMWLTAKALHSEGFTIPDDARTLIESVFGDEVEMPAGLEANAMTIEGQGFAAQTAAQMNSLKLTTGYERGGIDWWSEAQTPSRLGEASSNVALARWQDGQLRPWVDRGNRTHSWVYSSLRVPQRLIAEAAPSDDPALQAAMDAVCEELPAQGRWLVLLPLTAGKDGWTAEALTAARPGQAVRRMMWHYDKKYGLRLLDAADGKNVRENVET